MKILIPQLVTGICLALSISSAHATLKALDKVVAVVNESVILQSELNTRIEQVSQHARSQQMALPESSVLQTQVLDHLISEELQIGMAERVGFVVHDEQVNLSIERIRSSTGLSVDDFKQHIRTTEGMSLETLKSKVRREMTVQQIQQAIIQQRTMISGLEIDNFLKSADAQFWMSPEYHLAHILIPLPQSPNIQQIETAKKKALSLTQKINAGANFADIAIAESKGPSALNGGDIGWRKTSALPSLFAELVPSLKVGETSQPARSPAGFHILKLYAKKGEQQQVESQNKARHILLKTSAILNDKQAVAKLNKIRQKLIDGADFAEQAKEHSNDIGSMLSGGSLGWSKPGMFVPAFEKVINESTIGEISLPFQSPFGWHILQVEERRQEDITKDIIRNKAAQILTSRRFEDELQIWLRELRDEAFLNIKL